MKTRIYAAPAVKGLILANCDSQSQVAETHLVFVLLNNDATTEGIYRHIFLGQTNDFKIGYSKM